jgi:hypothetical protein
VLKTGLKRFEGNDQEQGWLDPEKDHSSTSLKE